MKRFANSARQLAQRWLPLWLLAATWLAFAVVSPRFRTLETSQYILIHAASPAIVAIGMTFVLLAAGIDLSVGAVMLVGGAIAGKLVLAGTPVPVAIGVMLACGLAWGLLNATLIARLRMSPFIVTLGMLFLGRGIGLWITQTKPINLPDAFRQLATARLLGIDSPVWVLALLVALAHVLLTRTPWGRQLYAVGHAAAAAHKAGVPVRRVQMTAYGLCSLCAAIGGAITLAQLSAVSPTLGQGRELAAIAAAVLGGVSLFGGRGGAVGAALGAVLIQTIYHGLNAVDADPHLNIDVDPYWHPLITATIIFLAVLLDSLRQRFADAQPRGRLRPLNAA